MASSNGKVVESDDRVVVIPEGSKPATGRIRWTVGLLVRLCIWYFLLTPFFRCPSHMSELTQSSPQICKPYLVAKSYVEPYIVPYYNVHAAPYVDAARPYVRVLNDTVYTPASSIAKQGYETYGAPALNRAQAYGQQQWDANVVPHIQTVNGKAADWYKAQVAPHVDHIAGTVSPYYNKVHRAYWATLDGYIMPFAAKYQPFIGKTYTSGQDILTTTVMPHAQSVWVSAVQFFHSSFWPKVFSLYSENVEPQLVKIGRRLASYREGDRLRSVTDEGESSAGYFTHSSFASVAASGTESPTSSVVPVVTPTPSLSPVELAAQTREKIASDLMTWKERFASVSEKGVESLEGRVVEIVDTYLAGGAQSDGDNLVTALESSVEERTTAIRHQISDLAESLPFEDAPAEEEAVIEELLKEIRNSAVSIRDLAHSLREWHVLFEQELIQKVSAAVNSTLAVLDNVRELGLQEIGVRWAWMDGVTYNDWEDYYALKEEFEDWKAKFREIGLQHARIEALKDTADETLSRGMDIAEGAAKELARLKEVGRWKIAAREVSEDFDTRSEPPPPLPKPVAVEEENIPAVQDEDREVKGEEQVFDVNSTGADSNTETDSESPELDRIEKPDENQEAGPDEEPASDTTPESPVFTEESTNDDNQVNAETPKPNYEADSGSNKVLFGAAAAAVPTEQVVEDTENLEQDEIVVEEIAEEVAEAASQSLEVEELNALPTPSQQKSIEDLLSELLADADPSFAEKVLARLNAINQTPQPSPESSSIPSGPVDGQPEQPQVAEPVIEPLGSVEVPVSSGSSTAAEQTLAADTNEGQSTQNDL
ncbi:hypothetical protein BJX76DRAFT_180470 [Aspergillus varians]